MNACQAHFYDAGDKLEAACKVYLVSDDSRTDMDYFLGVIDCIFRKR